MPQTKYYLSDFPSKITIIRRHHPLEGQSLELLSVGKAWLVVRLGDGSSLKLPRVWTDADGGLCTALTGHSQLCLGGLRKLLNLVKALGEPTGTEVVLNGEKIGPLPRGVGDVDVLKQKCLDLFEEEGLEKLWEGFPEAARAEVTAYTARLMAHRAVQGLRALRTPEEVGDEPNGHE